MTTDTVFNPMLDDDDDEIKVAPTAPRLLIRRPGQIATTPAQPVNDRPKAAPKTVETESAIAPTFGQPGFRQGVPNPHRGTPRSRATEADAVLLSHLGKFRIADLQTLSALRVSKGSNVSPEGAPLKLRGTEARLAKLQKLGMVHSDRALDGTKVWGATAKGIATAQNFGYLFDEQEASWDGMKGMSYQTLDHYRCISLVAAQFTSPAGYFKKALGIDPVSINALTSEAQIRRAQQPIADALYEQKKAGKGNGDFGRWRAAELNRAVQAVKDGKVSWEDFVKANRVLQTIGQPVKEFDQGEVKGTHWPDLVVNFDEGRTTATSHSMMIEIELSKKSWAEYSAILHTYAKEFERPYVYGRVIYFTISPQVETLLRKVDKAEGLKLFETGKLIVLPLLDRWGKEVRLKKRISGYTTENEARHEYDENWVRSAGDR